MDMHNALTFERTSDFDLVRSIMTHPRVYPHITDDGCPPVEEFHPSEDRMLWYILVRNAGKPVGLWLFVPTNAVCWEVHTCLLPEAWGDVGREAAKRMAEWIWQYTACRRIITNVPECNRLALRFAKAAGMLEFGRNEASFLKNGRLHAQIMLGLTKEEVNECPQQ